MTALPDTWEVSGSLTVPNPVPTPVPTDIATALGAAVDFAAAAGVSATAANIAKVGAESARDGAVAAEAVVTSAISGIPAMIAGKADVGTTLAEYGIGDAFTKTETAGQIAAAIAETPGSASVNLLTVHAGMSLPISTVAVAAVQVIPAPTTAVLILGYSTPGIGGGKYKYTASPPSHSAYFTDAGGRIFELVEKVVTPQHFGAAADSTAIGAGTADDTAVAAWFTYLKAKNARGLLTGFHRLSATTTFDFTGNNAGIIIDGVGINACGFNLDAGCSLNFYGANSFFWSAMNFRAAGNVAGPVIRLGKDDYSDAHNGITINVDITNASLNAAAEGLRVNYILQSTIRAVSNCGGSGRPTGAPGGPNANDPGHGKAVVVRQGAFNQFFLAGGQANIGLYLTGGAVFSNTFHCDIEEVHTAVACDGASVAKNTLVSGQYLGAIPYDFTAGYNNKFGNACNLVTYATGAGPAGIVGLEIETAAVRTHVTTPAPTIPASTVDWPNPYPYKVMVVVWAGSVSNVTVTATNTGAVARNPQVAGGDVVIVLHPGWSFKITYTGSPVMRVYPI